MKSSITKIVLVFFMTSIFTSCGIGMFNGVQGNKNVISKDRTSSENFNQIKVSTGLELHVAMGSENKVIVEADENLHDIIVTDIKDGILNIYSEKNIWTAKSKKVFVTVKDLASLSATSGANIYSEESLKVNNIQVRATSGADIKIDVAANSVITACTSGADIDISGTANEHSCNATSGASIEAYNLKSKNVTASVTSGAAINVFAIESIKASATSGGDIDFKGNPKNVDKSSSSGGSISKK